MQAYNSNKFVIDYLLGIKEIPKKQPQYIGMGDEDEAVSYVIGAWGIWEETNEAFDWLYEFRQKMLKMN